MKNFLIPGLVALLLFAVSAALSLWLNQSKEGAEANKEGKKPSKEASKDEEIRPGVRPNTSVGTEDVGKLATSLREQLASMKEREARLDRRQLQIDILLQDIRSEREVIENLRKQVGIEMKLVGDKMTEVEGKFVQLDRDKAAANKKIEEAKKGVIDITQAEDKNLLKMAAVYDSMPPENAAKILQQLADSGKLETAVKVLSQMKEAKAAKVLAEITDPSLSAQILEKMKGVKRVTAPGPTPMG
jgi:flagellar motility protein MotE (MotC chaperone)